MPSARHLLTHRLVEQGLCSMGEGRRLEAVARVPPGPRTS